MSKNPPRPTLDPEVAAINAVVAALKDLEPAMQQRVVEYVIHRFTLPIGSSAESRQSGTSRAPGESRDSGPESAKAPVVNPADDGLDGVSPVARKWISRSGLTAEGLSRLFSLGIDEIDLVTKKAPGDSKKDRMRSVILLKAVAAYLGSGTPRVAHDQVKEACIHYDAFDTNNFATYLKSLSAEIGGTREAGYTLTARGLTAATELVKELLTAAKK